VPSNIQITSNCFFKYRENEVSIAVQKDRYCHQRCQGCQEKLCKLKAKSIENSGTKQVKILQELVLGQIGDLASKLRKEKKCSVRANPIGAINPPRVSSPINF